MVMDSASDFIMPGKAESNKQQSYAMTSFSSSYMAYYI